MIKQCLIKFGGAVNEGGGQFSYQAGTQPSRCTIRTRLGAIYPQIGNLIITDGFLNRTFTNCRVVRHTIRSTGQGRMREITIEDRRWRWQLARVWGEYNVTDQGGRDIFTQKTARELATILLQAMGETQFDVTALPGDAYPEVAWDADHAAQALDSLCQTFGCLVTLGIVTDRVRIYRNNQGRRPLVDSRAMDSTPSAEPEVVPPLLIFEGGHTLWQYDLPLEPVGIETLKNKEVIVPIDNLSYKPTGGWATVNPRTFVGATAATNVVKEHRELAQRCVWRMFRVKPPFKLSPPPSALKVSGKNSKEEAEKLAAFFTVDDGELWRILPLRTQQVSSAGGTKNSDIREALLMGACVQGKSVRTNNVDTADYPALLDPDQQLPKEDDNPFTDVLVHQEGFTLDSARGIVTVGRPLYYLENGQAKPPYLRLRTSFSLRHPDTRQFVSSQYRYRPPSPTQGAVDPEMVKQSDVVFEIIEGRGNFVSAGGMLGANPKFASVTNSESFITLAKKYLEERLASLYPDEAISIPYKGFIFDYDVDGAIRSITWSSGPQGGTTQIDYAIERPELRMTHTQLRSQAAQIVSAQQTARAKKALQALFRKPQPKVKP